MARPEDPGLEEVVEGGAVLAAVEAAEEEEAGHRSTEMTADGPPLPKGLTTGHESSK